MNEREIRLDCLRLAHGASEGWADPKQTTAIIDRARAYADFVIGTHDGEVISAAREFAGKLRDAAA